MISEGFQDNNEGTTSHTIVCPAGREYTFQFVGAIIHPWAGYTSGESMGGIDQEFELFVRTPEGN